MADDIKDTQLAADAVLLIQKAWVGYEEKHSADSLSSAAYDTAWVSMVAKEIDGQKQWLFPDSFQYLLRTQSNDGSWGRSPTAQIDGILNTAVSLLSLHRHYSEPLNTITVCQAQDENLNERIHRATVSLASQLNAWDVAATTRDGFELVVPMLLESLRLTDPCFVLDFPGQSVLGEIHAEKMTHLTPDALYGDKSPPALDLLEAFIAKVDCDGLSHRRICDPVIALPTSEDAYLMKVSDWDDKAEYHLRAFIQASPGRNDCGVLSAFPSMYLENINIYQMLSTLLGAGFSVAEIQSPELAAATRLLEQAFKRRQDIIGFAPGLPADVDNTARCMICLGRMGREPPPAAMINILGADSHVRTYVSEQDSAFIADCGALAALLEVPEPILYMPQISRAIDFLCDWCWESDENSQDKSSSRSLYPSLLVVQAFVHLIINVEQGSLEPLSDEQQSRVHIVLFRTFLKALLRQPDSQSTQQVAFQVLILCEARKLVFFDSIRHTIDSLIEDQVRVLSTLTPLQESKASCDSYLLTQSYKLAALKAASQTINVATVGSSYYRNATFQQGAKFKALLRKTPLFASTPEWIIQVSIIEASLYQPLLQRRRLDIFPRKNMEQDKYFDLIPMIWTSCNNRRRTFASASFLFEMMVISFLDFQADEFMEAVAGPIFEDDETSFRRLIDQVFATVEDKVPVHVIQNRDHELSDLSGKLPNGVNGIEPATPNGYTRKTPECGLSDTYVHIRETLARFVSYVARHPSVQSASAWDRNATIRELRTYLHAHITQSIDNIHMARAQARNSEELRGRENCVGELCTRSIGRDGYFRWVRTTSGDHTACAYSFAFSRCLLSAHLDGAESLPTAGAKYLAAAVCQHLAALCRMYNDYGSVARDRAECNLNSVDFPEFADEGVSDDDHDDGSRMEMRKKTLFQLAQYERGWLGDAFNRLEDEAKRIGRRRQIEIFAMFCDVTDLFGEIYVVKDIASRMTTHQ